MKVQTGDSVKIKKGAFYYGGKEIPDWVLNEVWIVSSVNGDRAVLGKNEAGTSQINSPVGTDFLKIVKQGAHSAHSDKKDSQKKESGKKKSGKKDSQKKESDKKESDKKDSGKSTGRVSARGVELVAKYEGCRLEAYKCPAGVWTIGYGHTAGVKPGDRLPSAEAAKKLLREDLARYAASVSDCVAKGLIRFPLTQNQFDALTSFCYNCGAGNLRTLVSGRDAATVADKMLAYNKGGGKVLAGLTKRREEERSLFLT